MPDNEKVNSPLDGSHGMSDPNIARAYQSVKQGTSGESSLVEAAVKKAMDTNLLADTLAKRIKLTGGDQQSKEEFNKVQEELRTLKEVLVQVARDIGGKVNPAEEMRVLRAAETVQRTNERFAPKAPERPTDFHDRYPNINRPGYDMDLVRSDVRVARSHRAMGGEVSELPIYQDLLDNQKEIESQLGELHKNFNEQRSKGTPEGRQAAREIATQIASTTNLRAELTNILEHSAGKQASSFNKVMSFVGSLASTLGAASLVGRFAISEPYRYETQAGLNILGNQGEMGGALSSAFGELEEYKYGLNMTAFGTGAGMLTTGVAGMFGSGSLAGKAVSGALALSGVGIGAMGLTGTTQGFLNDVGLGKTEDEIMGQALAKQFSNPQRLISEFQTSRTGLYAMGGRGDNNFGMIEGSRAPGSTGNTYLDNILGGNGDLLRSLGYNRESLGALGSNVALSLRGSGTEVSDYARFAGEIGGLYGIGDESVISGLASAQRFGSKDASGSYALHAGVFEQEDGSISEFSMNVLLPALLQVTESMAIRNLARSTGDLEKEVTNFGRNIITGEGRISELAKVNPSIIGRLLEGLQGAAMAGTDDPALAAYHLSLGSSMSDIYQGKAVVIERAFQDLFARGNTSGVEFGSVDEFADNEHSSKIIRNLQTVVPGMSIPDLLALSELFMNQGTLIGEDGGLSADALSIDAGNRAGDIIDAPPAELTRSLSEQVDEFLNIQTQLIPSLEELQTSLMSFLENDNFLTIMTGFIEEQAAKFQEIADSWVEKDTMDDADVRAAVMRVLGGARSDEFGEYQAAMRDEEGAFYQQWSSLTDGLRRSRTSDTDIWNMLAPTMNQHGMSPGEMQERSIGGFTGGGGRHQSVGTVHAGEYVISSDNVSGNRELLDRIQSGERINSSSVTQGAGNVTYVTMKIHGASKEEILSDARRVTEEYIVRNRLNYT